MGDFGGNNKRTVRNNDKGRKIVWEMNEKLAIFLHLFSKLIIILANIGGLTKM